MAIELARIDLKMLLLPSLSLAHQLAQQLIKLIECLIGQILRQLKQMGHQQRMPSFCFEFEQRLRLVFAALARQLQDAVLMERGRDRWQFQLAQKEQAFDNLLDRFG
jgi:hypothetical protein